MAHKQRFGTKKTCHSCTNAEISESPMQCPTTSDREHQKTTSRLPSQRGQRCSAHPHTSLQRFIQKTLQDKRGHTTTSTASARRSSRQAEHLQHARARTHQSHDDSSRSHSSNQQSSRRPTQRKTSISTQSTTKTTITTSKRRSTSTSYSQDKKL